MKVKWLAKTKPGRWSVWLLGAEILFFLIFYVQVAVFNQRGGDTIFSNLFLTIPMFCAALAGIAAAITGFVALFRKKDKAVTVAISFVIGLLTLIFTMMQLIPE